MTWRLFWTAVFIAMVPLLLVRDILTLSGRLGPLLAMRCSVLASVKTLGEVWRGELL
jgi:hypothetical protein